LRYLHLPNSPRLSTIGGIRGTLDSRLYRLL
jgi:hypothetical protein